MTINLSCDKTKASRSELLLNSLLDFARLCGVVVMTRHL